MPIDQSELPIILEVHGGNFFLGGIIPLPFLFGGPGGIVRPESWSLTRPSRGTVTMTDQSAFLDDFNVGVPMLTLQGHTGWNKPGLAGLPGIKALETLFLEYLARRKRTADALGDPDSVVMGYYDVLNAQAFHVYPIEFNVDRQARRGSLLYYYRLRFWVIRDLLHSPVLPALPDFITNFLGDFGGISDRLGGLGAAFTDLGGYLKGLF